MLYSSEFRYELVSGCDSGLFTVKLLHFSPDFDITSRIYFLYIYGGGGTCNLHRNSILHPIFLQFSKKMNLKLKWSFWGGGLRPTFCSSSNSLKWLWIPLPQNVCSWFFDFWVFEFSCAKKWKNIFWRVKIRKQDW